MTDRILPPWPKEHSQSCFDVRNHHCVCAIENESQRFRMAGPWAIRLLREITEDDGPLTSEDRERLSQFLAELREGLA